jgi:hypothetical protein
MPAPAILATNFGQYHVTLFCRVNYIADWLSQAAVLTIEARDFFGSGYRDPSLPSSQPRRSDDERQDGY